MYYTYVLLSKISKRTYTGSTLDVQKRLEDHNSGKVKSSAFYKPFELLYYEQFQTKEEAVNRELFFKTRTGRRRLKEIFDRNKGDGINKT
ncbi:MAG TPA: GIY-YIG nuclease family protein [Candidatus Omnitrophota bacterium]|nr:GIY-YIG nuclease family protein [Candidatus Omnitrophota bacterium]HPD85662.1 GIY-YIG nuclease family protein [Candidatus Omnitrophota bacterium]HRZ04505.1 GIY-YIG nuclease family protein [Candidatus Omnitrophota bacterium]